MTVEDLVILSFPGSPYDTEVLDGGDALFQKHVNKLGLQLLSTDEEDASDSLIEASSHTLSKVTANAHRAWHFVIHHKQDHDWQTPMVPSKDYDLRKATARFDAASLSPRSIGVYIVAHCDHNVPSMFTWHAMDQRIGGITDAAERDRKHEEVLTLISQNVAGILKMLGLPMIEKLGFIACNIVPSGSKQIDFLVKLVLALHEHGLHPKVAGWDIPIAIITDEENIGRKRHTDGQFAAKFRKKHKYVYVYEDVRGSFDMKAANALQNALVSGTFNKETKKHVSLAASVHALAPVAFNQQNHTNVSKKTITWKQEIIKRLKFDKSGWSV